mmetsp:Transcript_18093/g.19613  ORF Transcript_18093/g.19613 Transcript_18093/m.19613 type:complete len:487 (-) Transcript_18093:1455-2915(-)
MTIGKPSTINTYNDHRDVEEFYGGLGETEYLLGGSGKRRRGTRFFRDMSPGLIPGDTEDEIDHFPTDNVVLNGNIHHERVHSDRHRSIRRRFFLFLTEPSSSWGSAVYFFILIFAIFASNLIIIMQTMSYFQYTPASCHICEGDNYLDLIDDDQSQIYVGSNKIECVCPPQPYLYLEKILDSILIFFAVEWTLRVVNYVPAHTSFNIVGKCNNWFQFLISPPTLIDALAIWPYFIEIFNLPGLLSLRLLRLFRVFQLVRLGKYNAMFVSLTNVLYKSLPFLRLMIAVLFFGASIFGSLLFWLEQGDWKYWEPTGNFQYVRMSIDGTNEEISPFSSIPIAFWWFIVTATTVGYGDYYPTSTGGHCVAACAMLAGVLVIAFPVSVFSDLWSDELKEVKGFESMIEVDSDNTTNGVSDNMKLNGKQKEGMEEYQEDNAGFEEFRLKNSTHIVMEKEDLNAIVSSIYTIQENQKRIQRITKKYYLHEDND